jgi:hypothetical protein
MRLRSVVLPAVVVAATAVAIPAPALAAGEQCTIILPTKVVVTAETVTSPVKFGSNCAASETDVAGWDLNHSAGYVDTIVFAAEEFADGVSSTDWFDVDPMGRYVIAGAGAYRADETEVTQNSRVALVKYGSRLVTTVTRTRTGLSWAVTAQQWSGRSHAYVARPRVTVGLFHQTSTSAAWKYVKSVTTTSTGRATVSLGTTKTGNYRLVVAETPTIWASYSKSVRGTI